MVRFAQQRCLGLDGSSAKVHLSGMSGDRPGDETERDDTDTVGGFRDQGSIQGPDSGREEVDENGLHARG